MGQGPVPCQGQLELGVPLSPLLRECFPIAGLLKKSSSVQFITKPELVSQVDEPGYGASVLSQAGHLLFSSVGEPSELHFAVSYTTAEGRLA